MPTEEFPSVSVQPDGPALQRVDGSREQRYIDEHGDRWVCVTDGVSRRWARCSSAPPYRPQLRLVHAAGRG